MTEKTMVGCSSLPVDDNFGVSFSNESDFVEFIAAKENESIWLTFPVKETRLEGFVAEPLQNEAFNMAQLRVKKIAPSCSYDGLLSTGSDGTISEAGCHVVLEHGRGRGARVYPLAEDALGGYIRRAKAGCGALRKLPLSQMVRHINECADAVAPEYVVCKVSDGKVRAVNSERYVILMQTELIKKVKEMLDGRFPGNEFYSGEFQHSMTSATWTMPCQAKELFENYNSALAGTKFYPRHITPMLRFTTSDVTDSSAQLEALIMADGVSMKIGNTAKTLHKGGVTPDDFAREAETVFSKFNGLVEKLTQAVDITLQYPENALVNIASELKVPEKVLNSVVEEFRLFCSDTGTASDVFYALQDIIATMRSSGMAKSTCDMVEEGVCKHLVICDWTRYDTIHAIARRKTK